MSTDMDGQTAELAAIYDAIYAGRDDAGFWRTMAATAPMVVPSWSLAAAPAAYLLPLARAGFRDHRDSTSPMGCSNAARAKLDGGTPRWSVTA